MNCLDVLVADDHTLLRAGLRMLINPQSDMRVVGEASSGADALAQSIRLKPHVVTMDISMPGGSGIRCIADLRQTCPTSRILVITMHDDAAYVRAVMTAGGAGYLLKTVADAELVTAIRAVGTGKLYFNTQVPGSTAAPEASSVTKILAKLSERELEVLNQLVRGHSNKEIATLLFISVKTVETHRMRIGQKLGLKKRAELVKYALEIGLLSPEPLDRDLSGSITVRPPSYLT